MSKHVVIETGGKQYLVTEGETLKVEKLKGLKEGDTVTFDKVLLVDDGSKTTLGTPYIEGATVTAEIAQDGRNKKVRVIRYRAKSRSFKKKGHKQPFAKVKIAKV